MYLRIFSGVTALLALLLTGCESSLKERFADVPPKTQEFDASPEEVYAAAQDAFKRLDFKIVWKTMGRIQAAGSIHHSLALGDSRQLTAELRFRDSGSGKTGVEMWLTQDVTGEGMGSSYRKPLPESDFFPLYFSNLQQFLDLNREAAGAEKK
jgi:hypothetical protein